MHRKLCSVIDVKKDKNIVDSPSPGTKFTKSQKAHGKDVGLTLQSIYRRPAHVAAEVSSKNHLVRTS